MERRSSYRTGKILFSFSVMWIIKSSQRSMNHCEVSFHCIHFSSPSCPQGEKPNNIQGFHHTVRSSLDARVRVCANPIYLLNQGRLANKTTYYVLIMKLKWIALKEQNWERGHVHYRNLSRNFWRNQG